MLTALHADPQRRAALVRKALEARDTPEHRDILRDRLQRQRRDPAFRDAARAAATRVMAKINADPVLRAKGVTSQKRSYAKRQAEAAGIPVELVPAYRILRRRRVAIDADRDQCLPIAECVALLRSSYPEAFAAFDEARRAAAIRACGPAPAIGAPGRAQWTRRVAFAVREVRP